MGVTVDTTRLHQSLEALDPAGRALLELSLGRGLPDEELADLLGTEPAEVGRRRAEVLEQIAEDLGVGGDRGAIRRLRGELASVLSGSRRERRQARSGVHGERAGRSGARPDGASSGEQRSPPPWLARAQAAAAARSGPDPDGQEGRAEDSPEQPPEHGRKPLLEQGELSAQRSGLRRTLLIGGLALLLGLGVLLAVIAGGAEDPAPAPTAAERSAPPSSARRPSGARPRPGGKPPPAARPRPVPVRGALVPLRRPAGGPTGSGPRGVARIVRQAGRPRLRLTLQGFPNPNGRYEVWLYTSRRRARSVTSFGSPVPALDVPLTADPRRYRYVDLSVEPPNGNPAHSVQSVVRAPVAELLRPAPSGEAAPVL